MPLLFYKRLEGGNMVNIVSNDLREIGKTCQIARIACGKSQKEVAFDTGYTIGNISSFECGHNNNLQIFLWYVKNTNLTVFREVLQ